MGLGHRRRRDRARDHGGRALRRGFAGIEIGGTTLQRSTLALLVGITLVAQSPAVVIALHEELDAEGPISRVAGRCAGVDEPIARSLGFGLLPQAGLALALAVLFRRTFPDLGPGIGGIVLSVVAPNELVAPILYRRALVRAGEAGAARRGAGGTSASARAEAERMAAQH